MTSTEDRLTAFFTAIIPHMEAHGIEAIMISITGSGPDCNGGFVSASRIGSTGLLPKGDLGLHLEKMHDDLHEMLEELVLTSAKKRPATGLN